jgi:hypothetical protein
MEDYSDRVEAFIGLGPIMNPIENAGLENRLNLKLTLDSILSTVGFSNILVLPPGISIIGRSIVHKFRHTMMAFIQLLCGGITPQTDPDRMAVLVRNEPGGTSL